MKILSSLVLASLVTAAALPALAADPVPQVAEAGARHAPLAEAHAAGELARYIVGPGGHVRGFMLRDGTVVMVRGRQGDTMAAEVALGQTVRVDGRSLPDQKVVVRATVYGPHGQIGTPPVRGERGHMDKEQRAELRQKRAEALAKLPPTSVEGTVQTVLTGHRGAPRTVLLTNGSAVFVEPSLARAMGATSIKVGDTIKASGRGGSYKNGTSIAAAELTVGNGTRFAGNAL